MYQSSITLKTLSRLSGYSISTVSKALNHKLDISDETKNVILSIAKEQNYKPNYTAISLRKRETRTIGVIIPEISNEFYGKLLSSLEKLASTKGYRLLFLQSFSSPKKEKDCFKLISDGSVDGIIVLSSTSNNYLVKIEKKMNIPPYLFFEIEDLLISTSNIEKLAKTYFDLLLREIKRQEI